MTTLPITADHSTPTHGRAFRIGLFALLALVGPGARCHPRPWPTPETRSSAPPRAIGQEPRRHCHGLRARPVELALAQLRLQHRPRRGRSGDDLERPDRDRLHADQRLGLRLRSASRARTAAGRTPTRSTGWSTRPTAATCRKACRASPVRPSTTPNRRPPGGPTRPPPGAEAAGASRSTMPTPTPSTRSAPGAMRSRASARTARPISASRTSTARAAISRARSVSTSMTCTAAAPASNKNFQVPQDSKNIDVVANGRQLDRNQRLRRPRRLLRRTL